MACKTKCSLSSCPGEVSAQVFPDVRLCAGSGKRGQWRVVCKVFIPFQLSGEFVVPRTCLFEKQKALFLYWNKSSTSFLDFTSTWSAGWWTLFNESATQRAALLVKLEKKHFDFQSLELVLVLVKLKTRTQALHLRKVTQHRPHIQFGTQTPQ